MIFIWIFVPEYAKLKSLFLTSSSPRELLLLSFKFVPAMAPTVAPSAGIPVPDTSCQSCFSLLTLILPVPIFSNIPVVALTVIFVFLRAVGASTFEPIWQSPFFYGEICAILKELIPSFFLW